MVYTRRTAAMEEKASEMERKLHRVSSHYNVLHRHYQHLKRRGQSNLRQRRSIAYNLTIRLGVLEGVINMVMEYMRILAEEIRDLRWLMFREVVAIVFGNEDEFEESSDSDWDDSMFYHPDDDGDDDDYDDSNDGGSDDNENNDNDDDDEPAMRQPRVLTLFR